MPLSIYSRFINLKYDHTQRKYYEISSNTRKYHIKLSEKNHNPKKYWTLLRTLLNGKKIPFVTPIYYDNKNISELKAKCELFNLYFAGFCTSFFNNSQFITRFTSHRDPIPFKRQLISLLNK